ncbi:protein phosphatase 2C domain-containing protein [Streptomyces fagopyri]|uniref:protein phosphatase 2C domain-containing protein n=1 Tax=Streptomyces fagopyri TaxID=2662397 RepID=UPI00371A414F
MSQQGESRTGHEDDWWGQLYDDSTRDTGAAAGPDSLDDRFASAAGTVGAEPAGAGPAARSQAPERDAPPPPGEPPAPPEPLGGGTGPWHGASRRGVAPEPPATPPRRDEPLGRRAPWEPPPAAPPTPFTPPAPAGPPTPFTSPAPAGPWTPTDSSAPADPPRSAAPPTSPGLSAPAAPPASAGPWAGAGSPAPVGPSAPGGPSVPTGPPAVSDRLLPGGPSTPADPPRPADPPTSAGAPAPALPSPAGTAGPSAPAAFPPGPTPPGFRAEPPWSSVSPPAPPPVPAPAPEPPPAPAPASPGTAAVPPWPPGAPRDSPAALPPRPASPGGAQPDTWAPYAPPHPAAPSPVVPAAGPPPTRPDLPVLAPYESLPAAPGERPSVAHVGSGPPTYDAEPTTLPPADPDGLDDLVSDTVLDGARYGASTLRAVSVRGDSARYRGEPRRDALLTARFGTAEEALVLVAMATGARATPGAHRAAAEACRWIGRAVGRSHARLAEDIRAARRGDLKSGLHRLTDRSLGKLRASAAEQGVEPEDYTASLRCLLLTADPECRTRVFFGVGDGGLFRLRDGEWQDIEPRAGDVGGEPVVGFGSPPHETPEGDRLTMDLGITTPPSPYEPAPAPPRAPFRFRASVARPGDTLLLCTGGLADPLRGEPGLCEHLTTRWSTGGPPGLAAFLADTQVRVKGYADDRTAAAVWEA